MQTSTQEALWVLRAQCDDRDALELLLRSVQPALRRYLCGLVGPTEADDVLQDVLVLVFRKLKWLETPALFRPWAFRIASRAGFRRLKRVSRLSEHEIDERTIVGIPAPDTAPPEALLEQLDAIPGLSPASRAVLVLHYQEDMTLPDIAAVLDLPLGTVKSRLAYGLTTLRKQVGRRRSDDRTLRNGTS